MWLQAVAAWTAAEIRDGALTLSARWPVLQATLFVDVKQKADILTQLGCARCRSDPHVTPLALTFSVPVEPWSHQSRSDRRQIKESVIGALNKKQLPRVPWASRPLCHYRFHRSSEEAP